MMTLNPVLEHRQMINQHIAKGFVGTALAVLETPNNPIPGHRKFVSDQIMKGMGEDVIEKSVDEDIELMYTAESITKFTNDLIKAFNDGEATGEDIEKAMKDLSKLTKRTMTDKNGQQRTVYVLNEAPKPKDFNPNGVMQKKEIADDELHEVAKHKDKLSHINRVRFDKLYAGKGKPQKTDDSVIGTTKSGKSVFQNKTAHHKSYEGFSSDDHHEAATLHYGMETKQGKKIGDTHAEKFEDKATKFDEAMGKTGKASKTTIEEDVRDAKKPVEFSKPTGSKTEGGNQTHIIIYSKTGMTPIKKEFTDEGTAKKFKTVMERSGYNVAHFTPKSSKIEKGLNDELNPQEQDDIRKGEIMDKLGMDYGGTNALTFTKTGKELKAILPITIASLKAKKEALETTMAVCIESAGSEPTEIYQSYQIKSIACKRYPYELTSSYDSMNNKSIAPTDEQKAMRQYNDACYAWQSLSEDIVACGIIAKNVEESKKYTLSVSQIIALQLGLISESM